MADPLRLIQIAAGVVIVVSLIVAVKNPKHAWRWLSGTTMNGKYQTNATWTRPATRVMHPTGKAVRWHKMPRLSRAAIRTPATVLLYILLILTVFRPMLTAAILAAIVAGGLGWAIWWLYRKARRWWPA